MSLNEGKTFADVARAIRSAQLDGVVQMRGGYIEWHNGKVEACGLGAMAVGFGARAEEWPLLTPKEYRERWPVLNRKVQVPGLEVEAYLSNAIVYLNDAKFWTLGQIADWLVSLPEPEPIMLETDKEMVYV